MRSSLLGMMSLSVPSGICPRRFQVSSLRAVVLYVVTGQPSATLSPWFNWLSSTNSAQHAECSASRAAINSISQSEGIALLAVLKSDGGESRSDVHRQNRGPVKFTSERSSPKTVTIPFCRGKKSSIQNPKSPMYSQFFRKNRARRS